MDVPLAAVDPLQNKTDQPSIHYRPQSAYDGECGISRYFIARLFTTICSQEANKFLNKWWYRPQSDFDIEYLIGRRRQMTSQVQIETQNKEVVQRYWDGKWNKRSPEILDELQTPDVIYHGTSMNMNGIEEYKQVYGSFLSAFHDTQITVEELIAEGDKVTSRVSLKGTHKGEFDGLPPTGKVFTAKAFTIFRLVDGKIVEEWEAFDELGLMHQLGMELRPTGDVESNELACDLEAITALREENLAAINASDVSTLLTEFTDDVVFLPDDQPPVVGKAALEAWVRPIYEQYDFEIEGTVKEVVVAGDWAFEWGLLTGTFRLLAGGEDMQVDMKYVYVYERQPDGSWRCAYDIVNKNVPSVYPVPIQD